MEGHQRGGVVLIVALLMLVSMPYSSIAAEQDGSCCSSQEFDLFLIGSADDGSLSPFDSDLDEEFDQYTSKPTIIICNKADIPGALDEFGAMDDRFGSRYPVLMFSAEENVGEEELGTEIFQALNIMRVYTISPRERLQDFKKQDPIVLSIGSTVGEAAHEVHKDLSQSLKFAILWGKSGKFEGQRVGRNHRLHDGDVIEIHS